MKLQAVALSFVIAIACTPQQSRTADDVQAAVLSAKDIACVFGSLVADPVELAKVCKLADKIEQVVPVLRGLIGVRDAAARAGVTYQQPTEGDASTR